MSKIETKARQAAADKPCVVIDWDEQGNHRVYADPGVVVFSRSAHVPDDALYRYTPPGVPKGWLECPAGSRGDGSTAEMRVFAAVEGLSLVGAKS